MWESPPQKVRGSKVPHVAPAIREAPPEAGTPHSHTRTGSDRRAVAAGEVQEPVIGHLPQPSPSKRQVFRKRSGD